MRKIFTFLVGLLFISPLFAQQSVQTQPRVHNWTGIYYNATICTTANSSEDFGVKISKGVCTVWLDTVSTSLLGNITVELQLYNAMTGEWGEYYAGNDICTITASGLVWPTYIDLAEFSAWAWADKAKIKLTSASGSAVINGWVGGQ